MNREVKFDDFLVIILSKRSYYTAGAVALLTVLILGGTIRIVS